MTRAICILFADFLNMSPLCIAKRHSAIRNAACISLVFLNVAACATATPPTPTVTTVCLPMAAYTAAQQRAAGAALAALPPDSPLVTFMADYGALRAADRACMAAGR